MKKSILCCVLALALLLTPCLGTTAYADGDRRFPDGRWNRTVTVDGETYDDPVWFYELLEDGTARLTRYYGNDRDLILPEKVDGYPVSTLAEDVFADSYLPSVTITIPDCLTVFDSNPFDAPGELSRVVVSDNHPTLELVDNVLFDKTDHRLICAILRDNGDYSIPDGTRRVEDHAFRYSLCSNATIYIPASVTELGSNPFAFCNGNRDASMLTITVAEDNPTLEIVDGMLYSKTDHRLVCYAEPSNLDVTFYRIPEGTETIDDLAFSQSTAHRSSNALETVIIPASVNSIGINPFYGLRNLQSVVLEEGNGALEVKDNLLYSKADHRLVCGFRFEDEIAVQEGTRIIGEYAFAWLDTMRDWHVSFPDSVEEIGNCAFSGATSLSYEIPETVIRIGVCAFEGCVRMTNDLVFRGDLVLAYGAFWQVWTTVGSSASSLTILDGGRVIVGPYAFCAARNLDHVWVSAKEAYLQSSAFSNCEALREATLDEGCRCIGDQAFFNCGQMSTLTLPTSVEYIGVMALDNAMEKAYNEIIDTVVSVPYSSITVSAPSGSYAEQYCLANGIECRTR